MTMRDSSAAITQEMKARSVRTFLFAMATDEGPRMVAFRMSHILIGRLPDNHLSINHGSVSRRHAKFSVGERGVVVEDMGSQNGTSVNGTPVKGKHPVKPGDVVRIGHVPVFYFGFIDPSDPPCLELVEHSLSINPTVGPM